MKILLTAMAIGRNISVNQAGLNLRPALGEVGEAIVKQLLLSTLGGLLACAAASAATISVLPSSKIVSIGDRFAVDLHIADLGDGVAPSIGAFDVNFHFDPVLISFVDAVFGTGLDVLGFGSLQIATASVGTINLLEISLDTAADLNSLQPAAFVLATLTFDALMRGTSPFDLALNALGDGDGAAIGAVLAGGFVTIEQGAEIPEPASGWLVIGALGLLAILQRRKSSRNGHAVL